MRTRLVVCCVLPLLGCAAPQKPAPVAAPVAPPPLVVPSARLPQGVTPRAYTLELTIDPAAERFSGRTQISVQLDAPAQLIFLHGRGLHVQSVRALAGDVQVAASYTQLNDDGVAALNFASVLPAGEHVLELAYDAPFDPQLKGLFRVQVGAERYVFSQLEAISARLLFPCFDEPRFKTPFDVWLTVPAGDVAVSNGALLAEEPLGDGLRRVHFGRTSPLPTYLVAFAVGPFDVVNAAPIGASAVRSKEVPLRGLAVKGKGAQLAHALSLAGPQLLALERYFGLPYAYEKLDLVAVPDFGPGAMENAGLVTFREWLLLVDPKLASEAQKRASAYVMAHELAHQWVGNLVTMPYWDELWLNEAFATFLGHRVVGELMPEHKSDLALLEATFDAMDADSRASARMIRQPITSSHDISNAFDGITYSKGAALLAMLERFLGAEVFQQGLRAYLAAHAHAGATTDDLLAALSAAAGRDVAQVASSFLSQVGVPAVDAKLRCAEGRAEVSLSQRRYLPLGSHGEPSALWQIPVCVRYELEGPPQESCTLLTEPASVLGLGPGCPRWLMPNADGAGYYRFSLPAPDLAQLLSAGFSKLTVRERVALFASVQAGFESGAIPAEALLAALPVFAGDPERSLAVAPMELLRRLRGDFVSEQKRPALQAFARKLYAPHKARLGFRQAADDTGDTKLLRGEVLAFLANVARDPQVRTRLSRMARSYLGLGADGALQQDALPPDLADAALRVLVEDGDEALFDALYTRFTQTTEPALRARLLSALSSVRDARSGKALALALDPALRLHETTTPLRVQLGDPRTREPAWLWLEANLDALIARLSKLGAGSLPWLAASLCSDAAAERAQALFGPRVHELLGGPRSLAGATEAAHLCAAQVAAHRIGVEAALGP